MKWRKWNRIIHRDLGYICFGLIIVYSISGVAVNHVSEWNPNYIIEKDTLNIPIPRDTILTAEQSLNHVINSLQITDSIKSYFRPSPEEIQIFIERKTYYAKLNTGMVVKETVSDRRVFRETNFLHLNNPKNVWTYVADAFAVSLALLAITGLFMIKGKKGITGRGKWLTALGILIPILFLIIYF